MTFCAYYSYFELPHVPDFDPTPAYFQSYHIKRGRDTPQDRAGLFFDGLPADRASDNCFMCLMSWLVVFAGCSSYKKPPAVPCTFCILSPFFPVSPITLFITPFGKLLPYWLFFLLALLPFPRHSIFFAFCNSLKIIFIISRLTAGHSRSKQGHYFPFFSLCSSIHAKYLS